MSHTPKPHPWLAILLAFALGAVLVPATDADPGDGSAPNVEAEAREGPESITRELRKIHAALQVIDIAIGLVAAVAAAAALSAYTAVALGKFSRRARARREGSPRLALVLGTINLVGLAIVCGILDKDPDTKAVAVLAFLSLAILLFLGAHVSSGVIGRRILDELERRPMGDTGVLDHAVGMTLLGVQSLLPVVGWLYLAYQLAVGAGAAILAIRRGPRGGDAQIDPASAA